MHPKQVFLEVFADSGHVISQSKKKPPRDWQEKVQHIFMNSSPLFDQLEESICAFFL
jgi:hypothetical protein